MKSEIINFVQIKRDAKRFAETLTELKSREKSPTYKKKERLVLKFSKDIKDEQPKLEQVNGKIRVFTQFQQILCDRNLLLKHNSKKRLWKE